MWPEHDDRRAILRAALDVAAAGPPRVVRGDLLRDLSALLAEAPRDATVVVTHTAVLAYVDEATRDAFARLVAGLGAHRLGAEATERGGRFEVTLDGRLSPTANRTAAHWSGSDVSGSVSARFRA